MTQEQYIIRAKELRGVMLPEHKEELDESLQALSNIEDSANITDPQVKTTMRLHFNLKLQTMVDAYEAYRNMPPTLLERKQKGL